MGSTTHTASDDARAYAQVAAAIAFLAGHRLRQPSLAEVAAHVGLSEHHFQRLFARWAGVSPKQYLRYLTKESALRRLRESHVLDAAWSVGLSGGGRLHDLLVSCEGVTPGDVRRGGDGLEIRYGLGDSPFGLCFVASTARGICKLAFIDDDDDARARGSELAAAWPLATRVRDDAAIAALMPRIFPVADAPARAPLRVLLRGSEFQLQVWQALLAIPEGDLCTYQGIAAGIGRPEATRAVASAIARNDIGYLIPCHRVIRASGEFSHYRWGDTRKQVMIAWEAARAGAAPGGSAAANSSCAATPLPVARSED